MGHEIAPYEHSQLQESEKAEQPYCSQARYARHGNRRDQVQPVRAKIHSPIGGVIASSAKLAEEDQRKPPNCGVLDWSRVVLAERENNVDDRQDPHRRVPDELVPAYETGEPPTPESQDGDATAGACFCRNQFKRKRNLCGDVMK